MFYAWRLVKRKRILNTSKFCVDSEKTRDWQEVSSQSYAAVLPIGTI